MKGKKWLIRMNWVDFVILGTLILFLIEAIGRSLISEILDFLSFLLAFFISFNYYNLLAKFFEGKFSFPHGVSLVAGFMATWFLSETVFFLLIRLFPIRWPQLKLKGEFLLTAIPAFFRGVIFISLLLVLIGTFPIQPNLKKAILNSKIGSLLQKNAYQLEQPVKNVFGGVTSDSLTFLTIKPKTDERINLGFQTDEFQTIDADEQAMIELVNRERKDKSLKELSFDYALRQIARGHSADMFKKGYFSHYSPEGKTVADRATEAEIDFLVIGENLAYAPSVELAHKGLMNSEGHRANILSEDYHKIGIGVMDGGIYGKMFTQVFSN